MKRNCLKATQLIMIFTEIHTVQESICVSCAAKDSARQDCWKFICEFTLERNPTTATFVGKTLDNQVTWKHMSGSTRERDLTSVRTVGRRLLTRAQETDTSKNVFLSLQAQWNHKKHLLFSVAHWILSRLKWQQVIFYNSDVSIDMSNPVSLKT